jgi:hypothetical protein
MLTSDLTTFRPIGTSHRVAKPLSLIELKMLKTIIKIIYFGAIVNMVILILKQEILMIKLFLTMEMEKLSYLQLLQLFTNFSISILMLKYIYREVQNLEQDYTG